MAALDSAGCLVRSTQFAHAIIDMEVHRTFGYAEDFANLAGSFAIGSPAQHIAFAFSQLRQLRQLVRQHACSILMNRRHQPMHTQAVGLQLLRGNRFAGTGQRRMPIAPLLLTVACAQPICRPWPRASAQKWRADANNSSDHCTGAVVRMACATVGST